MTVSTSLKSRFKWLVLLVVLVALITPTFTPVRAQGDKPTVSLGKSDKLGSFLVAANGMTLYIFKKDKPGSSTCVDKCAEAWPAYTVDDEDAKLIADKGVPGKLGVIERADKKYQVTYNDWPLYFFAKDKVAGDATGQGVGDVWYVIKPELVIATQNDKLGTLLADANGMTLYTFKKDEAGKSSCADKCAEAWPPLTVADEGEVVTGGIGVPGKLGVIERTDKKYQVTYNDMPLYYFAKDKAAGDTTGQNVGEVWFVAKPETIVTGSSDTLGKFLTAANGKTLYTFKKDEPGKSNCVDKCLESWPALTVVDGETPTLGKGLTGKVGTIKRADGKYQVTYNDMPLYYFAKDKFAGDTTGQNVGDVWFVVKAE